MSSGVPSYVSSSWLISFSKHDIKEFAGESNKQLTEINKDFGRKRQFE
jgi:hypothetical protein